MIQLSYSDALKIQERQILWYRQSIGRRGVKKIRQDTKPCPDNICPTQPIDVTIINRLIPRGCSFEFLDTYHIRSKDPLTLDWFIAMENGKLYH